MSTRVEPPWVSDFTQHVLHTEPYSNSPEFSLGTIHPPSPIVPYPTPRVRTLIFRGFWGQIRANPHNKLANAFNPPLPHSSELLTFTTDARMEKALGTLPGRRQNSGQLVTQYSGGGADVECCFWVKDVQTQWRVRGECYLLSLVDIEHLNEEYIAELRRRIEARFPVPSAEASKKWSYTNEILAQIANLSPVLRGSFLGDELRDRDRGGTLPEGWGEMKEPAKIGDEELRRNFRVAVVLPRTIERVGLAERGGGGRRWVYERVEGGGGADGGGAEEEGKVVGGWRVREVWP
ncbi:pyridoxamine 5'-phosphate oxidase-domain-containing protein [Peziza echinospora]|nr:pyridoxamine 5'-phosphate oxidase-domain-containing protein [Peziza echinospora]